MSAPKHPLDPITAAEIVQVSTLLKAHSPNEKLHFKIITIIEPPKYQLRGFLASERNGEAKLTLPRRASALYYFRGTANLFLAEVNVDSNSVESVKKLDPQFHGQNDIDEMMEMRDTCLQDPTVLEEIKKFKLPEDMEVVCDGWPYGRDSEDDLPRYVQVRVLYTYGKSLLTLDSVIFLHAESIQDLTIMIPHSPFLPYLTSQPES
jgi:primary-amine oxidase